MTNFAMSYLQCYVERNNIPPAFGVDDQRRGVRRRVVHDKKG